MLSFAGERIVYFYAPGFLTVHQSTWLQYLFFIFFLLQVLTTILLHLEDPEKHLDSLPLGIMIATILVTPWFPHGLIPFVVITSVEVLASTCLIAAVSVTTESQGWTIGVAQVGGLALNAVGWSIVRLPGIGQTMSSPTIQWNATSILLLLAEFGAIALMLGIAFFVQSRKRDFV